MIVLNLKKFAHRDELLNALIGDHDKYDITIVASMFKNQIDGTHNYDIQRHGDEGGWESIRDQIIIQIVDERILISDGHGDKIVETDTYRYNNRDKIVKKSDLKYLYMKIGSIPAEENATVYITEYAD